MADETAREWEFYFCKVDDAPASIFLDFAYGPRAPVGGADTLYAACISMLAHGPHGMGERSEMDALGPVEDRVGAWARANGVHYVGRLRNHGVWQMTFYGPRGRERALRRCVEKELEGSGRSVQWVANPDPEWGYFREFLWPSAERLRWIRDRRTVEALEAEGDTLERPRRVDHWAYFPSAAARDEFVAGARELGVELAEALDDADGERPVLARVHRVDSVRLDDVHEVANALVALAERCGGEYDGWETQVP